MSVPQILGLRELEKIDRRALRERLKTSRKRLSRLQKQKEQVESDLVTVTNYVQYLESLRNLTSTVTDQRPKEGPHRLVLHRARRPVARRTIGQVTYEVLRHASRPLHLKEIVKKLRAQGLLRNAKRPVVQVRNTVTRLKQRFRKTKPATFTILKTRS